LLALLGQSGCGAGTEAALRLENPTLSRTQFNQGGGQVEVTVQVIPEEGALITEVRALFVREADGQTQQVIMTPAAGTENTYVASFVFPPNPTGRRQGYRVYIEAVDGQGLVRRLSAGRVVIGTAAAPPTVTALATPTELTLTGGRVTVQATVISPDNVPIRSVVVFPSGPGLPPGNVVPLSLVGGNTYETLDPILLPPNGTLEDQVYTLLVQVTDTADQQATTTLTVTVHGAGTDQPPGPPLL